MLDPATLLESDMIRQMAFFPRRASKGVSLGGPRSIDGTYAVDGAEIGWRAYPLRKPSPVIIYFHGNGEIAAEAGLHIAPLAHRAGCALVAVDFRGYGWSTGEPSLLTLCSDAAAFATALPGILATAKLTAGGASPPLVLYGRSIGSVCAIELASRQEDLFEALVLESAVEKLAELPMARQLAAMLPNGAMLLKAVPDPFTQCAKLATLRELRVLVLHGQTDAISPFEQGGRLHAAVDASLAEPFEGFPRVGHNDIHGCTAYATLLHGFLTSTVGGWQAPAGATANVSNASDVCANCAVQ